MKSLIVILMFLPTVASAGIKFNFANDDLTKMIDVYSIAANQKFVVDPSVHGKATISQANDVSNEEAFNLLSSALAINGFAISKQGDTMIVKSARNIQKDLIETVSNVPELKPERMVTYIVTLKNISADEARRELNFLPSKDGEMTVILASNQLILTDFTSNLNHIDTIIKQIDIPADPKMAKLVDGWKKERLQREAQRAEMAKSTVNTKSEQK